MLLAHPPSPIITLHHFDNIDPIFPNKNRTDAVKHLMQAAKVGHKRSVSSSSCIVHGERWENEGGFLSSLRIGEELDVSYHPVSSPETIPPMTSSGFVCLQTHRFPGKIECCNIMNMSGMSVMNIKLRECRKGERTTTASDDTQNPLKAPRSYDELEDDEEPLPKKQKQLSSLTAPQYPNSVPAINDDNPSNAAIENSNNNGNAHQILPLQQKPRQQRSLRRKTIMSGLKEGYWPVELLLQCLLLPTSAQVVRSLIGSIAKGFGVFAIVSVLV
ncbi:hypothetical protein F3Y22_tig00111231pilonHSYRG00007 [Hibiscus syriacus]|uniref:Uncharacterized protein n=1 Tax=Hibiscus syriacus TaxID=106335 RepID=A0A6A2YUB1_HIBSY|nr:hypothetical protein F3Y22_tig00111231pilonHSYRG00007 [Hibiscus syriacus]